MPGGWEERMTLVRIPFSSMICWTMWPGGTCIGIGRGGPLFETIRTVAGPTKNRPDQQPSANTYGLNNRAQTEDENIHPNLEFWMQSITTAGIRTSLPPDFSPQSWSVNQAVGSDSCYESSFYLSIVLLSSITTSIYTKNVFIKY